MKRLLICLAFLGRAAGAYDYEGHFLVNDLAISALPSEFPAFVKTEAARRRIGFLGGEPDRWRNTDELSLKHANHPDHYFDFEDLAPLDLKAETLTPFRYEFIAHIAKLRAAHPERFEAINPQRDPERIRQIPGLLPWTINEYYAKLESGFSALKAYQKAGALEFVPELEQNIIYIMGVMGHFVADASQPLHTTRHYNGWVGENPRGFTTNKTFHAWIDGGFLAKVGRPTRRELEPQLRPAQVLWTNSMGANSPVFARITEYIGDQFKETLPLYELEKNGSLGSDPQKSAQGRVFICRQMVRGAQELADLWMTAFEQAPPDPFLLSYLARQGNAAK